jgi:riboflavin kinase / FMN adenylyltransferase
MKAKFIRGLINLPSMCDGCVITIGNFDGIHRGHQSVLDHTVVAARERELASLAFIFEPQPSEYFHPEQAKPRLSRLREKYTEISKAGLDYLLCVRFSEQMASLSAEAFIENILVNALHVKHIVIGDDFHFGQNRRGNIALLKAQGEIFGFTVEATKTFDYVDSHDLIAKSKLRHRISSTSIRKALADGNLSLAEQLLGRPFSMFGRVGHGDKRGRLIGFPTANLYLHRRVSPIQGVYAVKVYGLDIEPMFGVANVGHRPTVDDGTKPLLEVHLFQFHQDIYGRYLRVDFMTKIRDEKKFSSFEALKAQILEDAAIAKHYFGIHQ